MNFLVIIVLPKSATRDHLLEKIDHVSFLKYSKNYHKVQLCSLFLKWNNQQPNISVLVSLVYNWNMSSPTVIFPQKENLIGLRRGWGEKTIKKTTQIEKSLKNFCAISKSVW